MNELVFRNTDILNIPPICHCSNGIEYTFYDLLKAIWVLPIRLAVFTSSVVAATITLHDITTKTFMTI